ncbi:MAG: Excalibur calcium-binding protein, partial [Frankiales bacterium]|nr:Excalibur calcium-binding protein [Frankiales bacterium]
MARRSPARSRIGVRLLLAVLGLLLLVGGLATCGTPAPAPRSAGTDPTTGRLSDTAADTAIRAGAPTSALAALADVPVKGRAPRTGYQR